MLLSAPTGRAAQRMSELTGDEAKTLHRLLEVSWDKQDNPVFNKNERNQLKCDALIVDEVSMVDTYIFESVMRALPLGCRLILVGDSDQLPSVGPGNVLSDLTSSNIIPVVRLNEIFRQAQQSLIVMNAHRVNRGQMPELRNVKSDFFFLGVRSEEELAKTIVGLCSTRLPKNMGIPADQIQVLSPTRKGAAGTGNLNRLLQQALNPAAPTKKERTFGEFSFREGDRVMQIRNNYDIMWKKLDGSQVGTGIFNGDVGVITEIAPAAETLTVVYDDREADYTFEQLSELEPAYAMTVHKSQGSGATRSLVKS